MYMLPSEIKRNFDLMREKKVLARCADHSLPEPTEKELNQLIGSDEALQTLQEKHNRVVQKLDEKIAIAAQSYDIVDHHIRRLDRDLESYAALLKANGDSHRLTAVDSKLVKEC
ncbi:hypothetical protein BBJ29_005848 [Phytophthora kernoviae]|uniref:Inhibitor of growth protein N-terminal histone-binding domain-containing protein n=1 Tax=Phytophthora kernoviae TaxID=325452 RepID=A0A3F2RH64_9STRA|nr:hypothetical protein BBJ29_005848 [Phytophthora kernoviae]RLN56866.1 hypothetical protein BBP00_00007798 [Phytophthora kernoviae]